MCASCINCFLSPPKSTAADLHGAAVRTTTQRPRAHACAPEPTFPTATLRHLQVSRRHSPRRPNPPASACRHAHRFIASANAAPVPDGPSPSAPPFPAPAPLAQHGSPPKASPRPSRDTHAASPPQRRGSLRPTTGPVHSPSAPSASATTRLASFAGALRAQSQGRGDERLAVAVGPGDGVREFGEDTLRHGRGTVRVGEAGAEAGRRAHVGRELPGRGDRGEERGWGAAEAGQDNGGEVRGYLDMVGEKAAGRAGRRDDGPATAAGRGGGGEVRGWAGIGGFGRWDLAINEVTGDGDGLPSTCARPPTPTVGQW